MTTYNHTAIVASPKQAANAATFNGPLAQLDAAVGDLTALTSDVKTSVQAAINSILDGCAFSGGVTVTGTLQATTLLGNGAGITGLTGATGGISNTGSTTIQADSDANGVGEIALQIAATTHMILKNDGKIGIGTSAPDGVFEVHQAADGETKTLLVVRATDAGSPSGALIMGFNAAMDDEFWRFDANGSFQVVDIDGDNYINLYRGNDSVYINISRSTAAAACINFMQGATIYLTISSSGVLTWDNATLSSLGVNVLATGANDKLGLGITDINNVKEMLTVAGNIGGANVFTDDTIKSVKLVCLSYSNEEESVCALNVTSQSDNTATVYIGGGSSIYNCATNIGFYTAANATTTTGKLAGQFNSSGYFGVGPAAVDRLLHVELADAGTNTVAQIARISHATSDTAAAGFGAGLEWELEDDAGTMRIAAGIEALWADATAATRKGRLTLNAYDSAAKREGLRIEGDGSEGRIAFYGQTAVVRQSHIADAAGGATVDAEARAAVNAVILALENYGLLKTS